MESRHCCVSGTPDLREKNAATVEKYVRDTAAFCRFAAERAVTKELTLAYKAALLARCCAVRTVNSALASLSSLFAFLGWPDCRLK